MSLMLMLLLSLTARADGFQPADPNNQNNSEWSAPNFGAPRTRSPIDKTGDPFCDVSHKNAALMIIDMQDKFALRGRQAYRPENAAADKAVIDQQLRAIDLAKKSFIPIIFVEYQDYGPTNSALKDAVAGYSKKSTVIKNQDGVFDPNNKGRQDLAKILKANQIGTRIVAGANGGACVHESIAGALAGNCKVISFEKGVADFNYKKFITPYHYNGQQEKGFDHRANGGMCVTCKFVQVNSADNIAPFMVGDNPASGDTKDKSNDTTR